MSDDKPSHRSSHDLNLPAWGPYSKKWMGISHIPNPAEGLRFDFSVIPALYRRAVFPPHVKSESGYHSWDAAPDLSFYSHRHELIWKDQVYLDISFSKLNENSRLMRAECVNRTAIPQILALHLFAWMNFPPVKIYSDEPVHPCVPVLPEKGLWIDALDYQKLQFSTSRPTDNLVPDGMLRGEIRKSGFVNGSGIAQNFGGEPGDCISFKIDVPAQIRNPVLLIRARSVSEKPAIFLIAGSKQHTLQIPGSESLQLYRVPLQITHSIPLQFRLVSQTAVAIELDGFVLCEETALESIHFHAKRWDPFPRIEPSTQKPSLVLQYENVPDWFYGISWNFEPCEIREFISPDLESFLRRKVHEHVALRLVDTETKGDPGHFINAHLRPLTLAPESSHIIYACVCAGRTRSEIQNSFDEFDHASCESIYNACRQRSIPASGNVAGKEYEFGIGRMRATTLTNVVYPIYTKRSHIRHYTPGRNWDCLYTWDSGFIGLGLLELDSARALECLQAYLTEPGDVHAAFIHHGSPVPVQIFLFLELWNRNPSRELLEKLYPSLKQYYGFLAGRPATSSTTRNLKSNLLKTWDYFYNSGGWDDYPPQKHVHAHALTHSVTPVIITALMIRTARILQMAASELNLKQDLQEYAEEIVLFSRALHEHSWDSISNYFSYVTHDDSGRPNGILRHSSGANFNQGLDGCYPLVAGICSPMQERHILNHLQNPGELWSPIGLTAVSQDAPYYQKDGYWNGTVWMPHQWFFWKTMLDLNHPEFAWKIAETALNLWQKETKQTYHCFEHFVIESGRGAGWHQFSGLSSPILSWYHSYFAPGRFTAGFDVLVQEILECNTTGMALKIKTYGNPTGVLSVLVTLKQDLNPQFFWNEISCIHTRIVPGCYSITLPCADEGILRATTSN